ncbi:POSSIBLE LINOLEOYL-CoA DESATURASE (DELTA(6)-DESATURASE) [hydrothermal vent metagenome]|uniref:POSSIBLE LINOLEOYL-CoA DESATURASE (DELTA(6)-DESATURASE) n=1 Tax=hydrothermal vent metagenome TaxID=652676 RepID=A0A1W1BQL4_9ZZZZ
MAHLYAKYEDIDKNQFKKDIEDIKEKIGVVTWEDYKHLRKLELWGWALTFIGYALMIVTIVLESYNELSGFLFWGSVITSALLIGFGNVSRWMNVAHPILHGAYDKVPNIPYRYTRAGFARNKNRFTHWFDWITPEAWEYEHNIMHHYHLGELDDPDNVERNMEWLRTSGTPMFLRYLVVYVFVATWKFTYYAPNTLRILENKERRKRKEEELEKYVFNPFTKSGKELWLISYLPYAIAHFILLPLIFFPFGVEGVLTALIISIVAELIANAHSFLVIVPNHSAGDIYMFNEPHKNQGEFYLRQIMGSVNYYTGSDLIDASQGFLNYQIEHHLFPSIPLSYYQKMQPLVKDICKKHNLEYRQESVFKRLNMTIDLMIGKTKALRVNGI